MRTRVVLLTILLAALPVIAEAAGPRTFRELASDIVDIMSAGVATLLALAIVIYIWGIATHMWKLSEGDPSAYKNYIVWGIVILFVMVSIWGILNLLRNTLFTDEQGPYTLKAGEYQIVRGAHES